MTAEALILVAVSLSIDAFGASLSRGAVHHSPASLAVVLKTAGIFGAFAAAAPVLGWGIGVALYSVVAELDHWFAFFLLGGVGAHMCREALRPRDGASAAQIYRLGVLLVSALATSVDAAVIGMTLPLFRVNLAVAASAIGLATFVASLVGFALGRAGGRMLGSRAEFAGGLVLIAIGTKILAEHLLAA